MTRDRLRTILMSIRAVLKAFSVLSSGLRFGQGDQVVMVDAKTGQRSLTSRELAEQTTQLEQRAIQAEDRAARLAELLRAQDIDPDQV